MSSRFYLMHKYWALILYLKFSKEFYCIIVYKEKLFAARLLRLFSYENNEIYKKFWVAIKQDFCRKLDANKSNCKFQLAALIINLQDHTVEVSNIIVYVETDLIVLHYFKYNEIDIHKAY